MAMFDAQLFNSYIPCPTCRDVRTGTLVATWKGNSCNRNCLSLVGRDYVAAAQTGKGSLHFWTWHKVGADLSSMGPWSMCQCTNLESLFL